MPPYLRRRGSRGSGRTARRALPLALATALTAALAAACTDAPRTPAPPPQDLALTSLRTLPSGQPIYFAVTDRFADGDPSNDRGGRTGDRLVTGYDPTDPRFFHGGDLRGLTEHLDYVAGLGAEAVWITPIVTNQVVQGAPGQESAGYHGYWGLDFTSVDPHLGTEADAKAFVAAAHARGLKVYLDVVVNHTADLIRYGDGSQDYISSKGRPWLDASGRPFDPAAVADTPAFPALDLGSFPHQPVLRDPADASAKKPEWLDDLTAYHNRGESTYTGEDVQYGDIAGLDDLFTEDPRVLRGMTAIVDDWVGRLHVDGLRLDTVKHVNPQFWAAFVPAVTRHAHDLGIEPFYVFGEVLDPDPLNTSPWVKAAGVPEVLDFPFQAAAVKYVTGGPPQGLADLFDRDDLYTDADSNAYSLATFLGNHDLGRVTTYLVQNTLDEDQATLLRRDLLAHDLLFLARGNPVVYYGDEQGLTGDGGDAAARQDLGPTRTPEYAADRPLGGTRAGGADHFDPSHPLYRHIAALAALTRTNPDLRSGSQVTRLAQDPQGVFAFSRTGWKDGIEYVVALNSTLRPQRVAVPTYSAGMSFTRVWPAGTDGQVTTDADRSLALEVPPLSSVVLRAAGPVADPPAAPTVTLGRPADGGSASGPVELTAEVSGDGPAQVTFAWRPAPGGSASAAPTGAASAAAGGPWTVLGTDDAPPYRVTPSTAGLAPGTRLQVRAVVLDRAGHRATADGSLTVAG